MNEPEWLEGADRGYQDGWRAGAKAGYETAVRDGVAVIDMMLRSGDLPAYAVRPFESAKAMLQALKTLEVIMPKEPA